jgi:plasmid maintenance system antidote protein VapI
MIMNYQKGAEMNTSIVLLERVKSLYNLPSDYALAKKLHVTHGFLVKIRKRQGHLSDKLIFKVAKLLKMNPSTIWLNIQKDKLQGEKLDAIDREYFENVPTIADNAESLMNTDRDTIKEALENAKNSASSAHREVLRNVQHCILCKIENISNKYQIALF